MMLPLTCGLLGLMLGYWINRAVERIPRAIERDRSVFFSWFCRPARCLHCHQRLRFPEQMPILGWVWQAGRCRHCLQAISWRQPLLEALTALAFTTLAAFFGAGIPLLMLLVLLTWLLPLLLIDWQHFLLPDSLTLSLLWLGLLFNLLSGQVALHSAVLGAASAYMLLCLLATGYSLLRQQEGIGLGDAKLLAALGAWLGWESLPLLVIMASLLTVGGLLVRRTLYKVALSAPVPFGPALALAGFVLALYLQCS